MNPFLSVLIGTLITAILLRFMNLGILSSSDTIVGSLVIIGICIILVFFLSK
jgi:hypothetical protein